jgi:hypothetical protein
MMERMSFSQLSLIGAVGPTVILIAMTLMKTGGVWEYALDDVYIHLAMSEQLWNGGYGVNAGEYASASSSILYSYLLAPLSPFGFHSFWPLCLGLGSLVASAILWARVLVIASTAGATQAWHWSLVALAALGPLFLGWPGMALVGMEHMLHIMVTLMVLLGLLQFVRDGRVGWLLIAGIVLNPLFRFEGMAIAVVASSVVFFAGRKLTGLGLLLAAIVPLAAHFALMNQLGLDMLPNSVNAKAAITGGGEGLTEVTRWTKVKFALLITLGSPSGRMLFVTLMVAVFALILARRQITGVYRLIGIALVLAVAAHAFLGQAIWFYRYEVYVWTFAVGAGVVLLSQVTFPTDRFVKVVPIAFVLAVLYGGAHYPAVAFNYVPSGGAAIYAQQRQMSKFAEDFWKAPIAVNDLGHVAYRNPNYVLDLWGLASADALEARLRGSDPLWADKLAVRYDVQVAMIYTRWLGDNIPPNWIEVAQLRLNIPLATLGSNVVGFYATRPAAVTPLVDALKAFEPELPDAASLKFLETTE